MVGHGHIKETVGLLNVNSIHLNTLFDGRLWSQHHGFFDMTMTYHRRGCLNV
jgi:hypothetical protein